MARFSENLKAFREKANMSRQALAKDLNISLSAIGQYEQGRREPNLDTLIAIATALHVTTDELLGYKVDDVTDYTSALALIERYTDFQVLEFESAVGENIIILPDATGSGKALVEYPTRESFIHAIQQAITTYKKRKGALLVSVLRSQFLSDDALMNGGFDDLYS